MLVTMNELLIRAKQEGYAVPACNIDNEHNLRAAIEAAEETDTGIILNTTPVANPDLVTFGHLAVELARRSCVNIALNLDHGKSFADCLLGIRAGYTSIMIDRSLLPFEENVKQGKEMVRICHALGISVEAELGHVGVGEQYHTDGHQAFTRVEEAVEYVKQTGVDALAVAIGTAHGVYKGTPKIHFDLLHELKEALDIPLVLHGGSGTGDENLARCAREGINKVNLSNDLKRSAIENLIKEVLSGNAVYQLYPLLAEGFKNKIKHYIRLLGCEGK